jgi:pimeloyl-ACP methyl ester carboxylesterase
MRHPTIVLHQSCRDIASLHWTLPVTVTAHIPDGVRYHVLDNVDDVLALADALGLERFILLAHFWGAGVATYTAGIFPERISKLVLVEGIGSTTNDPNEAPSILRKAVEDRKTVDAKRKPVYVTRDEAIRARAQAHAGITVDAATCQRRCDTDPPRRSKSDPPG